MKKKATNRLRFKQKEIFDLNKKYNVEMFWTAIRGGKAFSAERKIRELKKRIFRLKSLEKSCQKKAKTTRDNLKRCQKHE